MRTTIKLLVALALAFATFNQHTTAAAAEVFKFKGQGVSAFFSSTDSSGCILTNVIIIASEDSFQTMPDSEETTSWIELAISQYDECAQTELLDAEGFASLADSDLQVTRKLDLATLDTTVNVEDEVSHTFFDVDVDLAWMGIGPLAYENIAFPFHSSGCNINSHFNGTSRPAEASGTISDGTTNFTPELSIDDPLSTYIGSSKNGVVSIGCD